MTRFVAIAAFIALSVFLFRYRTNKNIQHGVVVAFLSGLAVYTIAVVISELMH